MKYPHTDPEETMNYLKKAIKKDFPKLEEVNCTIKYVHKSLEDHLSPAFYLTPPIDNYKENSVYINRGGNTNMDELFPTLAHEGYPGHLFQNVYFSQQNPNPVRSLFNYGGYSEGWATYCELYSYDISGINTNVAEFAKGIGLNPSLLRNYINGFKKPSKEREKLILDRIHELGRIYLDVAFAS